MDNDLQEINTQPKTVKINDKDYEIGKLSDEAKLRINRLSANQNKKFNLEAELADIVICINMHAKKLEEELEKYDKENTEK